jgi:flagellar basal-body rod protein FlgB
MFDLLFDNTSMPILQQAMAFTERRQDVLAHNVANINTPDFRQTDLPVGEFTEAIRQAVQQRDGTAPHRFQMRPTEHIRFEPWMQATAQEVGGLTNYYDGADRSVERLQGEILKNAVWHEVAARLYSHQSQLMLSAIRERV